MAESLMEPVGADVRGNRLRVNTETFLRAPEESRKTTMVAKGGDLDNVYQFLEL
jgi:hypothetical protein